MIQGLELKKYVLVGGMSILPRSGTTHNMIVLANWLREKGYKVALLEVNNTNAFKDIANSIPLEIDRENHFEFQGINYYASVDSKKFKSISEQEYEFTKSYDFVIADFASFNQSDCKKLGQCDEKIVITGNKPWETEKLDLLFDELTSGSIRKLHFCFNFTNKVYYDSISQGMEGAGSVHFLKYTSDPFFESDFAGAEDIFNKYKKIEESVKAQRKSMHTRNKGSESNE